MALRRGLQLFLGALGVAVVGTAACSTFSEGDAPSPPPTTDAAEPDAPLEDASAPETDAGPCGDLTSDPASCGSCGHSCLGGVCEAGACQPFVFAYSPTTSPVLDLRLETGRAIWTAGASGIGETFGTTSLTGTELSMDAGTVSNLGALLSPGSLDSDGTHSFVSITGGKPTVASVGLGSLMSGVFQGLPSDAVVRLHSRDGAVDFQTTTDAIWTAPLSMMKANMVVAVGMPIVDFAVSGGILAAAVNAGSNHYFIGACNFSNCMNLVSVYPLPSPITSFAAEGNAVFWVEQAGTSVSRCVVDLSTTSCDGELPVLVTDEPLVAIRVDHDVLWAASQSNIYMCPYDQVCMNATPFVRSQVLYEGGEYALGTSFAANGSAFFWSDRSDGQQRIMGIAR